MKRETFIVAGGQLDGRKQRKQSRADFKART